MLILSSTLSVHKFMYLRASFAELPKYRVRIKLLDLVFLVEFVIASHQDKGRHRGPLPKLHRFTERAGIEIEIRAIIPYKFGEDYLRFLKGAGG